MATVTIQQALQMAFGHHQAGRLAEAESIYRQILAVEPRNADALHLLGLIAHLTGQHEVAMDLISQAIAVQPAWPMLHGNLGEACRALGRIEEAIGHYRRALALEPRFFDARNNLGIAFLTRGDLATAEACFAEAHALEPGNPRPLNNLGGLRLKQGRFEEAVTFFKRALALDPAYAEAHSNLGHALEKAGRAEEAIAPCERALELRPDYAEACNHLGNALQVLGRLAEALPFYERAVALLPNPAEAHNNLGSLFFQQGRYAEARASIRRALELEPQSAGAHWNQALLLLALGEFEQGWPEYEWRWLSLQCGDQRPFAQPQWKGEAFEGRTILLHAEQGWGDSLHMARYVPMVAARGGKVLLEGPPELREMLRALPGVERWITRGEALPDFALHCPVMSLPLAFGTVRETIPAAVPYLAAPAEKVSHWRARMGGEERFKVGLAWGGRPSHKGDRQRSMALRLLEPLLATESVRFFSLQKGPPAEQARAFPVLCDWTAELADFSDTAGLIGNLDLVIAVDTAVAHLAGALGKPVWTLIPFAPDWRWGVEGGESAWYPTMRLFRQPREGDWAGVVAEVAAALGARALEPRLYRS